MRKHAASQLPVKSVKSGLEIRMIPPPPPPLPRRFVYVTGGVSELRGQLTFREPFPTETVVENVDTAVARGGVASSTVAVNVGNAIAEQKSRANEEIAPRL